MNYIEEAFKSLEDIDVVVENKQPKSRLQENIEKLQKVALNENKRKSVRNLKEGFRGCKDVEMIWHGEWADPELSYVDENGKEYVANYWDVEDALWEAYKDEHEYATTHDDDYAKELNATYDWSSLNGDNDDDFNKFVQDYESWVIGEIVDLSGGGYDDYDESLVKKPASKKVAIKEGKDDLFEPDEKYNVWADPKSCVDMIHSIIAYSRDFKDGEDLVQEQEKKYRNYLDHYIDAMGRDKVVELADIQVKRPHKIEKGTYTDSEGLSYNSLTFLDGHEDLWLGESCKKSVKGKSLKESESINLNDDDEIKKGKEILNSKEEEETEQIVDVDADTIDKLKDSYIGNVILQCPVCRTLIYKKPDLLKKDEEDDVYNKDEECPHCGSVDGFDLVGQVASLDVEAKDTTLDTTGTDMEIKKDEVKDDIKIDDEVPNRKQRPNRKHRDRDLPDHNREEKKEEEEEIKFESLDNKKFDRLVNRYAHNVYENFKSYQSTSGKVDNAKGIIIVEGVISFKDGKSVNTRFTFNEVVESNKKGLVKFNGINETFSKGKKAFALITKVNNKEIVAESLKYNYKAKLNEEFVLVKGKVDSKVKKK